MCAVGFMMQAVLSIIGSEQACTTKHTERKVTQLLDNLAAKTNATVRFHASEMVLNIHSDESHLTGLNTKSRVAGFISSGKA